MAWHGMSYHYPLCRMVLVVLFFCSAASWQPFYFLIGNCDFCWGKFFPFLENQGQTCSIHLQSPTALSISFSYCEISAIFRVLDRIFWYIYKCHQTVWLRNQWMTWKSVGFLDSYCRITNGIHLYMMYRNEAVWTNYTKEIFLSFITWLTYI